MTLQVRNYRFKKIVSVYYMHVYQYMHLQWVKCESCCVKIMLWHRWCAFKQKLQVWLFPLFRPATTCHLSSPTHKGTRKHVQCETFIGTRWIVQKQSAAHKMLIKGLTMYKCHVRFAFRDCNLPITYQSKKNHIPGTSLQTKSNPLGKGNWLIT